MKNRWETIEMQPIFKLYHSYFSCLQFGKWSKSFQRSLYSNLYCTVYKHILWSTVPAKQFPPPLYTESSIYLAIVNGIIDISFVQLSKKPKSDRPDLLFFLCNLFPMGVYSLSTLFVLVICLWSHSLKFNNYDLKSIRAASDLSFSFHTALCYCNFLWQNFGHVFVPYWPTLTRTCHSNANIDCYSHEVLVQCGSPDAGKVSQGQLTVTLWENKLHQTMRVSI